MAPLTLRAKRLKQTFFVSVESSDTVLTVKTRLAAMVGKPKEAKDFRLSVPAAAPAPVAAAPVAANNANAKTDPALPKPPVYASLEDAGVVEQLGLADDAVVYFTYWLGEGQDGSWENVQIVDFEPLDDAEEDVKGKGHA
ncbi:hypothetical protein HDU98_005021 [Podochytrium sp. JEL0797]|nr:hypothetical protein HDU98_005021 [Podochytrium sp. JEL0797]